MNKFKSSFSKGNEVGEPDSNGESYRSFAENRSCTDLIPLIFMAVYFIALLAFIVTATQKGDIARIINGYDDCGNVCGKVNKKPSYSPFECFGKDMTDKKYLLYRNVTGDNNNTYITKECVQDCKAEGGIILYMNRCYLKSSKSNSTKDFKTEKSFLESASEDFQKVWVQIILMSLFAFVFSIIIIFLLRYATAFVVWFILLITTAFLIALTAYAWWLYTQADESAKTMYLYIAAIITVITVVALIVIGIFFKRIKLVIHIFNEAAKAIAAMPMLIFQPVWTFVALFVIYVCGSYFSLWVVTWANLGKIENTDLHNVNPNALMYKETTMALVTSGLNAVGILWMIQFVIGCQHLIIGGCVATWFFSRTKNDLGSPIITNTMNLLKFHLGTVAFGSLIITIVEIIRRLVQAAKDGMENRENPIVSIILLILQPLLLCLEQLVAFLTRNAYIMTAIYGVSFCKAGKKAFRLLLNNIFNVIAINSIGDYVLTCIKLCIVLFTVFIGYELIKDKELNYIWLPLVVIAFVAFFIAHCFITVFEMAIDAIFLCFCEDCEQNDGLSKPYYMSKNLMEFVENSRKIMKQPWKDEQLEAWENGPKRVLRQGS